VHLKKLALALVICGAACSSGDPASPRNGAGDGNDAGGVDPNAQALSIASPKANVRFLNAGRLSKTFAKALGLQEDELCKELGQFSCVDFIHKISLLGTDPYLFGVNDPLPTTTTSTPLVVERVATAGCVLRVKRDLSPAPPSPSTHAAQVVRPNGALFNRLPIGPNGKMNASAPEVALTIDQLYVRGLQRHAAQTETEDLRQLYRDIEALPASTAPAADWSVATCVAVLTSMESLFY
jgi:hypothetical protein